MTEDELVRVAGCKRPRMTPGLLGVLRVLYTEPDEPWSAADVADAVGLKPPTALAVLRRLVRYGWAVEYDNGRTRTRTQLGYVLTPAGVGEAKSLFIRPGRL